ncbi:MAG: sorbosone dehydrogenase family protein [Haloplanus sp.]
MTEPRTRRDLLRASGLLVAGLAGCGGGRTGSTGTDTPTATSRSTTGDGATATDTATAGRPDAVGTQRVAAGFTSPLGFEAPAGVDRRFVVDQPGQVYVHGPDGLQDAPFLDLGSRVVDVSGYDERGLLGMACHPNFADNGRLFVRYSAPRRSGTPDSYSHTFVLSEFASDPTGSADPDSERVLLEIPEPQSNHNAGSLAFGPDGYLYVGVGDGGGANDVGRGHVEDWYERNRGGNGQDVESNLLGSVLRLDVDAGGPDGYGIPDDNPLVGHDGLDEHWAWGFRNPWRFSFTDGTLYVADVGQNRYEEVDVVERGGNYGWNVHEGTHCFSTDSPSESPAGCPSHTLSGEDLNDPIVEYAHGGPDPTGVAVIGGYRYDGPVSALTNRYVFADWQSEGRLFLAEPADEGRWPVSTLPMRGDVGQYVLAFGRDPDGRLYVLTSDRGSVSGETGAVYRLVDA